MSARNIVRALSLTGVAGRFWAIGQSTVAHADEQAVLGGVTDRVKSVVIAGRGGDLRAEWSTKGGHSGDATAPSNNQSTAQVGAGGDFDMVGDASSSDTATSGKFGNIGSTGATHDATTVSNTTAGNSGNGGKASASDTATSGDSVDSGDSGPTGGNRSIAIAVTPFGDATAASAATSGDSGNSGDTGSTGDATNVSNRAGGDSGNVATVGTRCRMCIPATAAPAVTPGPVHGPRPAAVATPPGSARWRGC